MCVVQRLLLTAYPSCSENGALTENLTAPHQVTAWEADAVCIHASDGLGVAETSVVSVCEASAPIERPCLLHGVDRIRGVT